MSQMSDFYPNTSIPSILYRNNPFDIQNGSSKLLKISIKSISLVILSTIMNFLKKLKFLILINLHHFIEHYEARKD